MQPKLRRYTDSEGIVHLAPTRIQDTTSLCGNFDTAIETPDTVTITCKACIEIWKLCQKGRL